jgi:hypothetical protein
MKQLLTSSEGFFSDELQKLTRNKEELRRDNEELREKAARYCQERNKALAAAQTERKVRMTLAGLPWGVRCRHAATLGARDLLRPVLLTSKPRLAAHPWPIRAAVRRRRSGTPPTCRSKSWRRRGARRGKLMSSSRPRCGCVLTQHRPVRHACASAACCEVLPLGGEAPLARIWLMCGCPEEEAEAQLQDCAAQARAAAHADRCALHAPKARLCTFGCDRRLSRRRPTVIAACRAGGRGAQEPPGGVRGSARHAGGRGGAAAAGCRHGGCGADERAGQDARSRTRPCCEEAIGRQSQLEVRGACVGPGLAMHGALAWMSSLTRDLIGSTSLVRALRPVLL